MQQHGVAKRLADFSGTICPPSMNRISCFNMLTRMWVQLSNGRTSSSMVQTKRQFWPPAGCPPGVATEWCNPETEGERTSAPAHKRNKIAWSPCPRTSSKLGCFEQYVSMLMTSGAPGQQRRRRNSVMTRSAQRLCQPGVGTLQCYADLLKIYARISKSQGYIPVKRGGSDPGGLRFLLSHMKGVINKRDAPSKPSLCAASTDSIDCFERYLALYVRMNKGTGGKKNFIGRDVSAVSRAT